MIFSKELLFSEDQLVTATALSTNIVDLGETLTPMYATVAPRGDIGPGHQIPLLVQVTEDFDNATSVTVTFESSANADMSSSTVLWSQTVLLADLEAGKQFAVQVVPTGAYGRYLALRYTVTGTAPTTGRFFAGITNGIQSNFTGV